MKMVDICVLQPLNSQWTARLWLEHGKLALRLGKTDLAIRAFTTCLGSDRPSSVLKAARALLPLLEKVLLTLLSLCVFT
jgi:hypothetical protein